MIDRDRCFVEGDLDAGLAGNFLDGCGDAAPGRVAKYMKICACFGDDLGDQAIQGGGVAADIGGDFKPFTVGHDGDAVVADCAVNDDLVSWSGVGTVDWNTVFDDTDPGCGDKNLVSLAVGHDLGVAGYNGDPGFVCGPAHVKQDGFQVCPAETLLNDQSDTQVARLSPHHCQVIDGAVHRQTADRAARKKNRVNHERVGGVGQFSGKWFQDGSSVLSALPGTAQNRDDQVVTQLVGESSAAAVTQKDEIIIHVTLFANVILKIVS